MYISYGRSDLSSVATLYQDLQLLGHDVWLDREMPGGERWWQRVVGNIENCDRFIVAMSADAIDSDIARAELAFAHTRQKPVLPVLVEEGVSDAFLPPTLAEVQRVEYRQPDRAAMASLVRALQAAEPVEAGADDAAAAQMPDSCEHDVEAALATADYLSPELQLALLDQLRGATQGGLFVTRTLALLGQFTDRDDTTAKVAVKIAELKESLLKAAPTSALYELDIQGLPEHALPGSEPGLDHRMVFLSYSRSDHETAEMLATDVEGLGWKLWLDQKLPGGRKWWDEVLLRIRECDVFVFAASRASVASRACQSEIDYAVALGRPVISVVVGPEPAASLLSARISNLPVLRYDDPSKESLGELHRALVSAPAAGPLPDLLPVAPGVPATYLFDIRSQIQTPEYLTPSEQDQLFDQLRGYAEEGYPEHEVLELVVDLRDRDDVTRRLSDDLAAFSSELLGSTAATGSGADTRVADQPAGDVAAEESGGGSVIAGASAAAGVGASAGAGAPSPRPPPTAESGEGPTPWETSMSADEPPLIESPAPPPTGDAEPGVDGPDRRDPTIPVATDESPPDRVESPHAQVPKQDGSGTKRWGFLVAGLVLLVAVVGVIGALAIAQGGDSGRRTANPPSSDPGPGTTTATVETDISDPGTGTTTTTVETDIAAQPEWSFASLIPSFASGLGVSDYSIEDAGDSTTCEDYDVSAMVSRESFRLTPFGTRNHHLWAYTARFDSLDGLETYVNSWGPSGCSFRPPGATYTIGLHPPTWLNNDVLWFVLTEQHDDGRTYLQGVGVLGYTDRWVVEAQVTLWDVDGAVELTDIDPFAPYSNVRARQLAEDLAPAVIAVMKDL